MEYACIGVGEFYFDAAHYTKGVSSRCMNLHGHTFRVIVEVCGPINRDTGMVLDFGIIKRVVEEIISEYDHKILIPEKDRNNIVIEGPFNIDIKVIKYPEATTEYIALDIANSLYSKIKKPLTVTVYEGYRNYARVEINMKNSME